tara:strand:- start:1383 stop:1949 length:567 start_codon:yes stop_codon:yes gene_type:complete
MNLKITGGNLKSQKICGPNLLSIRPTSSKVRESIFNSLKNNILPHRKKSFEDLHILDVFCGSGIMGFEALSRGSRKVTFIEKNKNAMGILKKNAEQLKVNNFVHFINMDVKNLSESNIKYEIAFLDPPYFSEFPEVTINILSEKGWLQKKSIVIIETNKIYNLNIPKFFEKFKEKIFGNTKITFLEYN